MFWLKIYKHFQLLAFSQIFYLLLFLYVFVFFFFLLRRLLHVVAHCSKNCLRSGWGLRPTRLSIANKLMPNGSRPNAFHDTLGRGDAATENQHTAAQPNSDADGDCDGDCWQQLISTRELLFYWRNIRDFMHAQVLCGCSLRANL